MDIVIRSVDKEDYEYITEDEDIEDTLQQNILRMARQGASYKEIRLKLGNPSKHIIRKVIKLRDPQLFEVLGDTKAVDNLRQSRIEQLEESEDEQDEYH